jgi:hypothetical protein
MFPFAGASVPTGWLLCDGQAVSRTTYATLFTAIGETWGIGNGSTTFNVPDMRESAPIGAGTYSAVTGTTHGTITAHDARALGAFADDQIQNHKFTLGFGAASIVDGGVGLIGTKGGTKSPANRDDTAEGISLKTNGVDGTPRVGSVTRGKTIGVNFISKY